MSDSPRAPPGGEPAPDDPANSPWAHAVAALSAHPALAGRRLMLGPPCVHPHYRHGGGGGPPDNVTATSFSGGARGDGWRGAYWAAGGPAQADRIAALIPLVMQRYEARAPGADAPLYLSCPTDGAGRQVPGFILGFRDPPVRVVPVDASTPEGVARLRAMLQGLSTQHWT